MSISLKLSPILCALFLILVSISIGVKADIYEKNIDCENPMTTADMNYCARQDVIKAEDTMNTYLIATINANRHDTETVEAIMQSQTDWQKYRDSYCDAVYSHWRDGTIRGVMSISCEQALTEQRTHQLWQDFLRPMDDEEAVLSKPKSDI